MKIDEAIRRKAETDSELPDTTFSYISSKNERLEQEFIKCVNLIFFLGRDLHNILNNSAAIEKTIKTFYLDQDLIIMIVHSVKGNIVAQESLDEYEKKSKSSDSMSL